jgi:Ecdysteroid kinase-like family
VINLELLQIDFQLSTFATPAIDVFYLLYMIASLETRAQHREEILQYYFQVFQDAAVKTRSLNGRMPSKLDFQGELLKNGFLGE